MKVCKLSRLLVDLAIMLMSIGRGGGVSEEGQISELIPIDEQEELPASLHRTRRLAVREHYIRRYMTDHKGRTIQLTERAELLSLAPNGGPFPAKWRSSVTIRAPKGHVVRAQFLKIKPHPVPGICNQRMFIFDGEDTIFSRVLHEAMRPLCGDSAPSNDFISSGRPMTLQFVSDGTPLPKEHGFTASLTPIRLDGCMKGDFHCKNGYCINKYLSCDGYNNCGDLSDELKCYVSRASDSITSTMTTLRCLELTTIILGCVGIVVLIIMLIWYIMTILMPSAKPKDEYQHIDTPGNEKWNPDYYQ